MDNNYIIYYIARAEQRQMSRDNLHLYECVWDIEQQRIEQQRISVHTCVSLRRVRDLHLWGDITKWHLLIIDWISR